MGREEDRYEWYLADLVMETTVEDDADNVVHINTHLVHAQHPDQAYEKALDLGREGETSYLNSEDKVVRITFRGLRDLKHVVDEPLEHGAELWYEERVGVADEELDELVVAKEQLRVFAPFPPYEGPNCVSKDVIRELREHFSDRDSDDFSGGPQAP